jgi:hypothetical protein
MSRDVWQEHPAYLIVAKVLSNERPYRDQVAGQEKGIYIDELPTSEY